MKLQKPKGTQDILPADSAKWQYVENVARETFKKYNYGEIRTPMFEHYEVISRSVGDTTDIVTKEMYDFHDKGDRHITLRPEGTAPVVRSYVENKLFAPEVQKPVKVYYIGSMFRYERPQAGRLREFHQLGVECFGSKNPATDVETIAMAYQLFNTLGIKDVTLHLNSLGNTESRLAYRQALIDYLTPMRDTLSKDSQRRLDENPLRVLDSKEKEDKVAVENAPSILDYLDDESQAHFDEVRAMLDSLNIPYVIDTNLVRGLDYYLDTFFDIAVLGSGANGKALELVQAIRYQGFKAERDYLGRKIKAQFKSADTFKAKTVITLGESEVESGQVNVKNNSTREEVTVSFEELTNNFAAVLKQLEK